MNPYLKNLNKIEFAVTNACTGKCKHCAQGSHVGRDLHIQPEAAVDAVRKISANYDIKTVMAFGGEGLLYADAVCAIINAAKQMNVPKRQVITNGYFSKNPAMVLSVARQLAACGVNDLLLSVDAFHQETIPLEAVRDFAREAKRCKIPIRLQPAWLVSDTHGNPYNEKTREILDSFADMEICVGEGNIVFPEGNALKYFSEYFVEEIPKNPYEEDPRDIRCISFSPNGDVLGSNVYKQDIIEIIKNYAP